MSAPLKRLKSTSRKLAASTSSLKVPILILLTILISFIKLIEAYLRYIYASLNTSSATSKELSIIILLSIELI